nr:head maturation protease, ClpP-related [Heyndrickxia oleronia]
MKYRQFKNEKYIDQLKKIPHKFNVVTDQNNKVTKMTIYGIIGDSWWEDSTSATDIDQALNEAGTNDIIINLNSPGGDAYDGIAIHNRLKRHEGKVTIFVDGWACSAASIIALSADELIMGNGSMFMIHEAATGIWGKKGDLLKEADMLSKLDESLIDIYMTKANVDRDKMVELIEAETWFSAEETMDIGFADKIESLSNTSSQEGITDAQIQQIINEVTNKINNSKQKEPEQDPVKPKQNLSKLFLNL